MNERNLPQWAARLDACRKHGFSDLIPMIGTHYKVHESLERFLGPYNANQRNSKFPYAAPEKETLKQLVPQGRMNDFSYQAFLNSVLKFCEQTKGNRAVPTPHPSSIHSIQLPRPAFELDDAGTNGIMVSIIGIEEPIAVRGLRFPEQMKFIIVRPKLSSLGTASADKWEVLFFKEPHGYIPDWVDSSLNPRYSGRY